jgi:phosphoribosylformylglycinamidine synthase
MVWHKDSTLPGDVDLVVLPGGFTYGDYLRCGAIAAHSSIMREVTTQAKDGLPVLGICNGFQVLTEAGLLPGALLRNASLRFVCKDVGLRVENADTMFTRRFTEGQTIRIPVAHGDGNYFIGEAKRRKLEDREQVAFRYCDGEGQVTPDSNPNGSIGNIAGVFNKKRTILGLMPHPERLADPALGGTDGQDVFASLLDALG